MRYTVFELFERQKKDKAIPVKGETLSFLIGRVEFRKQRLKIKDTVGILLTIV